MAPQTRVPRYKDGDSVANVLIADDEANLRKVLTALLKKDGHEAVAVPDGESALKVIDRGEVDILITDLRMPGMTGLELLQKVKLRDTMLPVIVITAHGSVDTAVSALKAGAADYITKPFDQTELQSAVRKAAALREIHVAEQSGSLDASRRYHIVGQSRGMKRVFDLIGKVADTPSTVLITGESGTGKELVASALHNQSIRADEPFIKVNCAAIPKELMESEFFGYEQGAFTGAVGSKPGRFELADGGTLFLDEIGEIPPAMQVKLLRALQESEFERVGGVTTMKVNVRLIAATNRNLEEEIAAGNFREDLYYRLNVVPLHLPALRDRREDVPLLVSAFIDKYNERLGRNATSISPEAMALLTGYQWPGNIRELENVVERTVLFVESNRIEVSDLPESLRGTQSVRTESDVAQSARQTAATQEVGQTSMKDIVRQATVEIERDLIIKALHETHGNVTRAAHLLQISRKGLQNKMKEFGLREPESKF